MDPNAQLLASVIPPAPPSTWQRIARSMAQLRAPSLRSIMRWSRSREARDCALAALATAALVVFFYRSEASSVASTRATAAPHPPAAPAARAEQASLRLRPPAPEVLAAGVPSAPAAARLAQTSEDDAMPSADNSSADNSSEDVPSADASSTDVPRAAPATTRGKSSARSAKQRSRADKKYSKKKKLAKGKHKSKRTYAARPSTRSGRLAKKQRVATPGPLGAWLATRSRADEASAVKRR